MRIQCVPCPRPHGWGIQQSGAEILCSWDLGFGRWRLQTAKPVTCDMLERDAFHRGSGGQLLVEKASLDETNEKAGCRGHRPGHTEPGEVTVVAEGRPPAGIEQ